MPSEHKFLKFILSAKTFASVEESTRQWVIACPCGKEQNLWDAGGVRFKGAGRPKQMMRCQSCGKVTAHTITKKAGKGN